MTPTSSQDQNSIPSSPPPSFRSKASSPSSRHLLFHEDPATTDAERTLADTFDDGSDSDAEGNSGDDRQRLMRSNTVQSIADSRTVHDGGRPDIQRMVTQFPPSLPHVPVDASAGPYARSAPYSSFSHSNDGVFANLNAKPERGEKVEEQPPVSKIHIRYRCLATNDP